MGTRKIIDFIVEKPDLRISLLMLIVSAGALAGAYISQYGFGLMPCILCLYQRIPYAILIVLWLNYIGKVHFFRVAEGGRNTDQNFFISILILLVFILFTLLIGLSGEGLLYYFIFPVVGYWVLLDARLGKFNPLKALLIFSVLIFLVGAGTAAFHVGVEYSWWAGTEDCGGDAPAGSIEELRARIMDAPVVRCDEPAFVFLGLSMAGWNVLYSLGLAGVSLVLFNALRKVSNGGSSEKESAIAG